MFATRSMSHHAGQRRETRPNTAACKPYRWSEAAPKKYANTKKKRRPHMYLAAHDEMSTACSVLSG